MLSDNLAENWRPGKWLESSYSYEVNSYGYSKHTWWQFYERCEMKYVVAKDSDVYECVLTISSYANSKRSGVWETHRISLNEDAYLSVGSAAKSALFHFEEDVGTTAEKVLDRLRKDIIGCLNGAPYPKQE